MDTGRGTGCARYDTSTGAFTSYEERDALNLEAFSSCDVIVFETYTVTEKTARLTQQTDALQLIGALQQFATQRAIPTHGQPPSSKNFAKDPKLKALGWWNPSKDGHANDAARHLLVYALKRKLLTAEDMRRLRELLK